MSKGDGLFYGFFEGRGRVEFRTFQPLAAFGGFSSFQPNHHRYIHVHFFHRRQHAVGNVGTTGDSSENINEDAFHFVVAQNQSKSLHHLVRI